MTSTNITYLSVCCKTIHGVVGSGRGSELELGFRMMMTMMMMMMMTMTMMTMMMMMILCGLCVVSVWSLCGLGFKVLRSSKSMGHDTNPPRHHIHLYNLYRLILIHTM